jgi:beta-glucosidase
MINGGMLAISWAKQHVPAILEAWYPGQLGGLAIVNTLLGKNNPGGKTPITWYPSSILDRDIHDMDLTSGDGLTHLYYTGELLWPFGWYAATLLWGCRSWSG